MTFDPILAAPFTKAVFWLLFLAILIVGAGYFLYSRPKPVDPGSEDKEAQRERDK